MTLHDKIVRASEWGIRPIDWDNATHRDLTAIVEAQAHHSAGPRPDSHGSCEGVVRSFDDLHRDVRGWLCIGYHRVICGHGVIYLCRPLHVVPAACEGHNTPIIAYCFMGGEQKANAEQMASFKAMAKHDAATVDRALRLTTHREFYATDCPGDPIQAQIEALRSSGGKIEPAAPTVKRPLSDTRRDQIDSLTERLEGLARRLADKNLVPQDRDRVRDLSKAAQRLLKVTK